MGPYANTAALNSSLCFPRHIPPQIAKMVADLTALREEHKALVTKRNSLEDEYRVFATKECDMEDEVTSSKIAQARSAPQKNKRLQVIHEAHKAVLSKEAKIAEAEGELATLREVQTSNEAKPTASDAEEEEEEEEEADKVREAYSKATHP